MGDMFLDKKADFDKSFAIVLWEKLPAWRRRGLRLELQNAYELGEVTLQKFSCYNKPCICGLKRQVTKYPREADFLNWK